MKDYNAKGSDLSTISIDDDDEGNRYKGYPWVEDKEGNPLDKTASKALSSHLRTALNFVGSKKRAPNHWSHADLEVINYVRSEMYTVFPDLRLCAHHWKLDQVITKVYPSWKRNWSGNGGTVVVKSEMEEVEINTVGKKRKRDHSVPLETGELTIKKPRSKERASSKSKTKTRKPSQEPETNEPASEGPASPPSPSTASFSAPAISSTRLSIAPHPESAPGPASANTTSDITIESPSPVASPAAVDNVLEDVTNTTNVREMPAEPAKPVPKPRPAFKVSRVRCDSFLHDPYILKYRVPTCLRCKYTISIHGRVLMVGIQWTSSSVPCRSSRDSRSRSTSDSRRYKFLNTNGANTVK